MNATDALAALQTEATAQIGTIRTDENGTPMKTAIGTPYVISRGYACREIEGLGKVSVLVASPDNVSMYRSAHYRATWKLNGKAIKTAALAALAGA